uniref:Chloride channel protein n=1 Tax=Corethron hystrix TaxID=216773 RepID=A0A7S1G033_9STRA|mmetsp:Transcript_6506/g.14060  ORF Transcript_6506/g.14060 Transcript_6506/m.14060 type:complete len:263 (+) Transcript_6506:2-790(+)
MIALIEIPVGPIWTISDVRLPADEPSTVLVGFALGLLGAFVAYLFVKFHTAVMGYLQGAGLLDNKKAIYRALFGLCGILPLGLLVPHTLFWGEEEIQVIANGRPASELPHMFPTWGISGFEMDTPLNAFIVGATKMIAISFTVSGGYRGGFIFPFFAAGSAFGRCLYMLLPKITCLTPQVASLCFAAGINVAITRTALATTVILSALSGEINANSPILAASMASIFATAYMPFMSTQIAREDLMYEFSVSDRSDDHEDDEKH